jgi:hypothetical protein
MTKKKVRHSGYLIIGLLIVLIFVFTIWSLSRPDNKNVTFIIPIYTERFSDSSIIKIKIFNEQQNKLSRTVESSNKGCVIEVNLITTEEILRCPEGIEPIEAKIEAEDYSISANEITDHIIIKSRAIRLGEYYSLSVRGKSPDDCNTTTASINGIAENITTTFQLKDMFWLTTEMGCPNP